jgi:hypothetical protein
MASNHFCTNKRNFWQEIIARWNFKSFNLLTLKCYSDASIFPYRTLMKHAPQSEMYWFQIVSNILIATGALLGNYFVFKYYSTSRAKLVSMLYSSIAVVDSIGSLTALLQVVSFLLVEVGFLFFWRHLYRTYVCRYTTVSNEFCCCKTSIYRSSIYHVSNLLHCFPYSLISLGIFRNCWK